eukprot:CAMPEP_0179140514 /NCGR_PEP_ID=MMETSP0796-20121207/67289_1 /TAXON_ID=73915 /ORGANISM="Pyrodinium bahamense, Strain pbaha01" /LENGTH=276 /DNA_ID=CAMNT_0020840067 /DNA_START=55 /DNA_END=885 /DNA_ORIENTATION=+
MAQKFKMSDGTSGMLRGQVPDAFQRVDPDMPNRNYHNDTEHERTPFVPQKTYAGSTGFTSRCAGHMADGVMEQALAARMAQTVQQGVVDGYSARLELQEQSREVTQEEIDEREDRRAPAADDDDDLEALRARRREQMKKKHDKMKEYLAKGHGQYEEIVEEEFLKVVTGSMRCAVHFYHRNFERCKVADMHLAKIAPKFLGTKIVKLDAEKAPFFVQKLAIKTLPTIVLFVDGVAKHKQVGFAGLGNGDEFKTASFVKVMAEHGLIEEEFNSDDEL